MKHYRGRACANREMIEIRDDFSTQKSRNFFARLVHQVLQKLPSLEFGEGEFAGKEHMDDGHEFGFMEVMRIRWRRERLRRKKIAAVIISSVIFSVLAFVLFGSTSMLHASAVAGLVIAASVTTAMFIDENVE